MYVLVGGPRAGQLVDDLPPGYAAAADRPERVTVFDGYEAVTAVWTGVSAAG